MYLSSSPPDGSFTWWSCIHPASFGLLGRHILNRAQDGARLRQGCSSFLLVPCIRVGGQPKIEHLDVVIWCENQVGGLYITMHDAGLVRGRERLSDLAGIIDTSNMIP